MNDVLQAFVPPTVNPPAPRTEIVLSIDAFYGRPSEPRKSDFEAMKAALAACREQRAAKLVLPAKTYRFDDPKAADAPASIELTDLSDLTIDAQGSELIFHHITNGFRIRNCQRVLLKNFAADWDFPLASPGVMERQADGRMAIRISDEFPLLPGRKLAASVTHYDTANRRWIRAIEGEAYYPVDVEQIGPQLITSPTFDRPPAPPNGTGKLADGMPVCVRHYVYDTSGFIDFNGPGNSDLTFEGITVFQCPGHAFAGIGCDRGFRISNCRIGRRPGSNLLVSSTADGAHFGGAEGDIVIENCDFSAMGDDSVNIHGLWLEVVKQTGGRVFQLTRRGFGYAVRLEPGTKLKFCRKGSLAEFGRATIAACCLDFENKVAVVTVAEDLPGLEPGDFVANLSRSGSRFLIHDNFFHDHRARGMLLQAADGLVERNHIRNVMGCGLMLTTDCNYWKEGYGCENLVLRDNLIEGCNYVQWERGPLGRHMGCVSLIADTPAGLSPAVVHRNIVFERNTIRDTPGLALLVASSQDVLIKDNLLADTNRHPFDGAGASIDAKADGAIMVTRARDVTIEGNKLSNATPPCATGIYVDGRNTRNIVVGGNTGFE
ncbi:MAG: right-handed parallel beta-helix repeat-containing protein [Chthoniobacteraceae bacterium]|nr:right-handed parallel beta-helix repeat-containing protein [Chthoniobacteraceae bacterium]